MADINDLEIVKSLPPESPDFQIFTVRYHDNPSREYVLRIYARKVRAPLLLKQRMEELSLACGATNEHILDYGILPDGRLWTVTYPVRGMPLSAFYKEYKTDVLKNMDRFIGQIMNPLGSLHLQGIRHLNLWLDSMYFVPNVAYAELDLFSKYSLFFADHQIHPPYSGEVKLHSSPEMLSGKFGPPAGPSDLFQVMTILHFLLTGRWPLDLSQQRVSPKAMRYAILREEPLIKLTDRAMHEVFSVALSRDPGMRYQDAGVLEEAFLDAWARRGQTVVAVQKRLSRRRFFKKVVRTGILVGGGGATLAIASSLASLGQRSALSNAASANSPTAAATNQTSAIIGASQLTVAILSSSGKIAIGSANGQLAIRALASRKTTPDYIEQLAIDASIIWLAFSANGQSLLSCDEQGNASLWAIGTNRVQRVRLAQSARTLALSQQFLLLGEDGNVLIFENVPARFGPAVSRPERIYSDSAGSQVNSLAIGANGLALAAYEDRNVRVFSLLSLETIYTYPYHEDAVLVVATTEDGAQVASASKDGSVQAWSMAPLGERLGNYSHTGAVRALAWSPDGQYVASGGDDTLVKIYDVVNKKVIQSYTGHHEPLISLVWVDNQYILSADANEISVWQAVRL